MTLQEAREIVQKNAIRSKYHYHQIRRKISSSLPASPEKRYTEWVSWEDFLGLEDLATFSTSYRLQLHKIISEKGVEYFKKKKSGPAFFVTTHHEGPYGAN